MRIRAIGARVLFLALLWEATCHGQGTLRITFDGSPRIPPNSDRWIQWYYEAGMVFTPIDPNSLGAGFIRQAGGSPLLPNNGTAYLQAGAGSSLMFGFYENPLFGLSSVDLAEYSTVAPWFDVLFIGYRADASTLTTRFKGTGIDFQTLYFGPEWSYGLTRVEIPSEPWSLDNLVVVVPEPGTNVLFLGAIVGLCLWRRKRTEG